MTTTSVLVCPTCGNGDPAWCREEGSCTFGCGSRIHHDEGGMCPTCKEHSANRAECETCGAAWEDWDAGRFERAS